MKTSNLFLILSLGLVLVLSACGKEPLEILPGDSWTTSDGGTISFNEDGSGTVIDSDFFLVAFGNGPIENFTWEIIDSGLKDGNLNMDFVDPAGGSGSIEFPIDIKNKNRAVVGISSLLLDLVVELTR